MVCCASAAGDPFAQPKLTHTGWVNCAVALSGQVHLALTRKPVVFTAAAFSSRGRGCCFFFFHTVFQNVIWTPGSNLSFQPCKQFSFSSAVQIIFYGKVKGSFDWLIFQRLSISTQSLSWVNELVVRVMSAFCRDKLVYFIPSQHSTNFLNLII